MAGLFKNTNFIPSLLIAFSFLVSFSNLLESTIYHLLLIVLLSLVAVVYISIRDKAEYNTPLVKKIYTYDIVVWVIIVLFAYLQNGDNPLRLATLAYLIYSTSVAYIVSAHRLNPFVLKIPFYIISAYLIFQCLLVGVLPDEVLQFSAGGMMPSVLLCIAVTIQYVDIKQNNRINILPSVIILVISTYSISRTALVCALIYLLVTIIMVSRRMNNKIFRFILFAGIILLIVRYASLYWNDITMLGVYDKFERKGVDTDSRSDIWSAYFNSLGIDGFLMGKNVDSSSMILGFGNLHNSLIRMHSQLGIFSLIFLVYLIKVCVYYFKHNRYLLSLFIILLIRGSFDTVFFFSVFDYAIFLFLFSYRNNEPVNLAELKLGII